LAAGAEPWLAILNPASGNARRRAHWQAVETALRRAGLAIEVVETAGPRHGIEIARDAVVAGRRRILIAGGDGSAHDVVNGVMQTGERAREVTLALAPLGTGNDWARTLGVDRDPAAIAAMIVACRTVAHDVGVVNLAGAGRSRWFINVAGAGYDAFVLSRLPGRIPSKLAYLGGALRGLRDYRPPRFRVSGAREIDERLLVAFVAIGRFCGNAMCIAPNARIDDGMLDVVTIAAVGIPRLLLLAPRLYGGGLANDRAVQASQSQWLQIDASPPAMVEADGQLIGETPARFALVPRALHVVVPAVERPARRSAFRNEPWSARG
jgi:YegS/Rv2252/BmrU family lipid kinase